MPDFADKPKIAIGADHAGFHAKELIKNFLGVAFGKADHLHVEKDLSVNSSDNSRLSSIFYF